MKPTIARLRRILLVRNDRIGDLVLTLPAMQAVRRQWPKAHVAALVSRYAGPLLAGSPYVDQVLVDNPEETAGKLSARLAAMQFDAALVFNTSTRNCLAAWRAGIRRRVTWAYKPVGLLTGNRRVWRHRTHPPVHEAEFALEFVRALGGAAVMSNLDPRLSIDPAAQQRVHTRLQRELPGGGPLFGVHPGNLGSAYNWPADHYVRLVERLARQGRVMVTGSPAERTLCERMRADLPAECAARVGIYTDLALPELVAAIAEQSVLVVSSTGPMHVAGILGTPVVALFSPHPVQSPAKWSPLGSGHALLVAPLHSGESAEVPRELAATVMSRISVESVEQAALELAHRRAPQTERAA